MLGDLASYLRTRYSVTVPWSSCFGASPTRYIWVFLVAAHFQASARIAGAWALEVGNVFRRRGSRGGLGTIVVALVFVLVLFVIFFGYLWRRLLQRRIQTGSGRRLR